MSRIMIIGLATLLMFLQSGAIRAAPNPLDLLRAGAYDAARQALTPIISGRPTAEADREVFEAMIERHQGRVHAAAKRLRRVLSQIPNHEPARRELIGALRYIGHSDAAVFHAERLVGQTTDRRLEQELTRYIRSSRLRKRQGVSLRFALLPSSNINQGTAAKSFQVGGLSFAIDDASRSKSGVGVSYGATAWKRWQLSQKIDATVSGSVDGKSYFGEDIPTELRFGKRLDFGFALQKGRLTFGPILEALRQKGKTSRTRVGAGLSLSHSLDRRRQLSFSLSGYRQRYLEHSFKSGQLYQGSLNYRQILTPSSVLTLSLPFEHERTERAHLDHIELGLKLGWAKDWRGGFSTHMGLGYAADRYRGLFPGFNTARRDKRTSLSARAKHSQISFGRFSPEISYTYTRNRSNVVLYDYETHDVGFSLSKRF